MSSTPVPVISALAGAELPKSVVIVDDARSWRRWLRAVLEKDPRLRVVGEAGSAEEAREVIKATDPNVLTLDVEMPGMNGLRFLEHLMRLRPMPVIMFSGHTTQTSVETVRALSLGAVDCFHKSGDLSPRVVNDLRRRVLAAAGSAPQRVQTRQDTVFYTPPEVPTALPLILIGASTGGVLAIERTLTNLPACTPPMVIVQHMPASFLSSFVRRLDGLLPHKVFLAEEGRSVARGEIALARADGRQTGVNLTKQGWVTTRLDPHPDDVFTPSVDRLFEAAAPHAAQVVAAVLTGIGSDGARGAAALAAGGAQILVQSEATCVVYGMPRAVRAEVSGSLEVSLADMGRGLVDAVSAIETGARA
ncbi:MAG: chemotaxis protein CheB [Pseudomonadota bacterium]